MLYLAHLRVHTLLIATFALVIASAMSSNPFRAARTMAAIALLVIVPTFSAAGPTGHVLWKVGMEFPRFVRHRFLRESLGEGVPNG